MLYPLREATGACALIFPLHVVRRQSRQSHALWRGVSTLAALAARQIGKSQFVRRLRVGGAYRDRTDDPLLAKQVLSQLS